MSLVVENMGGGRLRELDGWRAVSVLLVIVHHIAGYQHYGLVSHYPFLDLRVQYMGALGVKVFFVISGFVICRLLNLEELRYGSVSLKGFYCRRIFRILPPFYTYLAVLSLLICLGFIQETWRPIFVSSLFLYDLKHISPDDSWLVGHTWSLAVEEQFYLIFPSIWVLMPKTWRGRVFLGFFFLIAAWNLVMVYTGWDGLTSSHTRTGFACICCGVLMAIYEARLRALANSIPTFAVAVVALLLLLCPVDVESVKEAVYESLLVPPAIVLVLLASLGRGGWVGKFLCSKPVQAMGLTSYGIYLWQQLFTAPRADLFDGSMQPYFHGAGQIIPMLLPLLCLVVPLSYFLIEKPAMRFGKALSQRMIDRSVELREAASGLQYPPATSGESG